MGKKKKSLFPGHLVSLHLAVMLFGLAGLFGKIILLPAILIVLGRVFFASGLLYFFLQLRKIPFALASFKELITFLLLGALLAFHWFSFFHSIQLSTVAIGLLTYASFPVFTVFLEPMFFKEKFESVYLIGGLFVFFGLWLIVPAFDLDNLKTQGVIWGILSGLSFSFLTILNRKLVIKGAALKVTFYQDFFAFIWLLPALILVEFSLDWRDLFLLLLLGTLFTAVAHYLYIVSLKEINARTASIIASLEPIYGILFAIILLGEIPDQRTLAGGAIILFVVVYFNIGSKKNR
jgi:drug/metabolite transporter (DMT)-like permease